MITVVVVLHLVVAVSMIGLILLQKTEGNSSGAGFSASANISSMMQPRTRANPLSRATVVMGIMFFGTSLGLALLSKQAGPAPSLFAPTAVDATAAGKVSDIRTDTPADATGAAAPAGDPAGTPAPDFGGSPAPAAAPAVPSAPAGAPAVPNN